jgi:sugar phosphate isomerase/epimerase
VKIDLFLALFHDRPLDEALQAAKAAGCQAVEIGTTGPHDRNIRVAIEPHPGFVVSNTATMLRLCAAAGANIGANVDSSHLFWQQIDPCASARALTGAIFAALGDAGYNGALSIEQEDPFRSPEEGVARVVATLRAALGRRVWSVHSRVALLQREPA